MKACKKLSDSISFALWQKLRFYIITLFLTAILLLIIILINHAGYIKENVIAAVISLLNTLSAYIVAHRKDSDPTDYKAAMKKIRFWTFLRIFITFALILLFTLSKFLETLPFIFPFIAFFILHNIILIRILQLETK